MSPKTVVVVLASSPLKTRGCVHNLVGPLRPSQTIVDGSSADWLELFTPADHIPAVLLIISYATSSDECSATRIWPVILSIARSPQLKGRKAATEQMVWTRLIRWKGGEELPSGPKLSLLSYSMGSIDQSSTLHPRPWCI